MMIFASRPYEMIKFLLKVSLNETRPKIVNYENNVVTVKFSEEFLLDINFDSLDNEYIQNIFTEENGIFTNKDYQKYFYETSRVLLVNLVLKVLELQEYLNTYNINYPSFMKDYETALYKLTFELKDIWLRFSNVVSLNSEYNKEITVNVLEVFELLKEYKEKYFYTNSFDIFNSDILSMVYAISYQLLHSMILNTIEDNNYPLEKIYMTKLNESALTDFIKKISETSNIGNDTKIKFFSLILIFYHLNRYFRIYSGISFNDPFVIVLANLGVTLTNLLKTNKDFLFIDQELFKGLFGTDKNFFSFTNRYDALVDFVNYKDNIAIRNDINIPIIHGQMFIQFLNIENKSLEESYVSPIFKYIQTNLLITKYKQPDNLSIDRSFNYLKDLLIFVESDKINTIDPFTYYQIVLIVSTYRYIKNMKNLFNSLDENKQLKITFGIWMGDIILYSLYNQWFQSGKFYEQVSRPKYTVNRIQTTLLGLRSEVDVAALAYIDFIKYLNDDQEEFKKHINLHYMLTNTFKNIFKLNLSSETVNNVEYSNVKQFISDKNFDIKQFISDIRLNKETIVSLSLFSNHDPKFELIKILDNIKINVKLLESDIPKILKLVNIEENLFYNDLLNALYYKSIEIETANINQYEYLFITTLPLLNYFDKRYEENKTELNFSFTTPENVSLSANYETLLNEYMNFSLINKYNKINEIF